MKTRRNPAMPEPYIWSSVLRGLELPLLEHNVDFSALLADCDVSTADLQAIHGEVPLKKYLRFINSAAEVAGDPLLGARLARSAGPETLGAVGFVFLSSRTLADALTDLCTYMNLLQDATVARLRRDDGHVVWTYQLYHVADIDCRQDVEFSVALTCRLIRMFGGAEAEIEAVSFRHARSTAVGDYERLFKTEIRFNQEENSIILPTGTMKVRGKLFDPSLSGVLKDFLDAELKRKSRVQSLADQIRRIMLDSGLTPPVTAAKAADFLGISRPTMYRRLAAEGTTYGDLAAEVNYELAKTYLLESDLTVTQIAHIIGFADSASFTRAFARWSAGCTPSRFRRTAEGRS